MREETEIVNLLKQLVAFDSTSSKSNLPLVEHIEKLLADEGIPASLVFSPDGLKANLWARLGPKKPGGLVLSGHTDVVPANAAAWSNDPWSLKEQSGKLYGRGTCDMKGFVACSLLLARRETLADLAKPIYIALSYDEEVGCFGVPSLIDALRDDGCAPDAVIVGEPTEMAVVNAQKATFGVKTTAAGKAAHSSQPDHGISATAAVAEIAVHLRKIAEEYKGEADLSSAFDPPYATLNVGLLSGGQARNIVAPSAEVQWDCRLLPSQEPDDPLKRLEAFVEDEMPQSLGVSGTAIIDSERLNFMPGLSPEIEGRAERLALNALGEAKAEAVSYGTEAGFFQAEGWSTIICGPGSIKQAHTVDEFIQTQQLLDCSKFLERLVDLTCRAEETTQSRKGVLTS